MYVAIGVVIMLHIVRTTPQLITWIRLGMNFVRRRMFAVVRVSLPGIDAVIARLGGPSGSTASLTEGSLRTHDPTVSSVRAVPTQ